MRIKNIFYSVAIGITLAATVSSCKKQDFNINENPNVPTDSTITYDVILPAALDGTGQIVANNWGWLQNYMGYWARSGTFAPNTQEETYSLTTSFATGIWTAVYNNNYDYQVMQSKAERAGAGFYAGIARIMKSHNFALLADFYNNIPYKQALRGGQNLTPSYDNGIDVYKDCLRQIDTGIALIKAADPAKFNIATNDIIFGSDQGKWVRFANTLKLRLIVHMHNSITTNQVAPGIDPAAELAIINNEGSGYLNTGEDVLVQPGYRSDKPNPFWNVYKFTATGVATSSSTYYKANSYALDYYTQNGDLRRQRFYAPGALGLVGVAYGAPSSNANSASNLAGIGPGIAKANSQPQWIMTAAESMFLQAEVLERYAPGSASAMLNAAIKENFYFLYDAAGDAALQAAIDNYVDGTYIAGNAGYSDVDYTAAADPNVNNNIPGGLYTIIAQKYFALNGLAPFEVYTDYRRTDIVYGLGGDYAPGPAISIAPQNTVNKLPTRLLYPQTEYNFNGSNVSKQGTIGQNNRVFWDLQ